MVEGDETFTVTPAISGLSTGVSGVTGVSGTGTITNDDSTDITLSVKPGSVDESATATAVTVTAETDGDTFVGDRTVTVSVGDGADSADSGTDYAAVSDFTITITAGKTSGTGTFTLTPKDDNLIEGDEGITVSGTSTGLTVTGTDMTLTDDDSKVSAPLELAAISLSADPSAVAEDAGATTVTVTATVFNGLAYQDERKVRVTVGAGGAATPGTDYAAVTPFDVTLEAGKTIGTGTFVLTPRNDGVVEGDETIAVTGTTPDVRVAGTAVTLVDNDRAGVSVSDARAEEGEELTFTATLSGAVQGGVVATPVYFNGSAGKDVDYRVSTTSLAFEGKAGERVSFTVPSLEDETVEGDETFTVGVIVAIAPSGVDAGEYGTGTIEDDDRAVVTVSDARVEEGGALRFTATVDKAVQGGFRVRPVLTEGSASAGADYAENTATLAFAGAAGETATFRVGTVEDAVVEHEESFVVSLDVTEGAVRGERDGRDRSHRG